MKPQMTIREVKRITGVRDHALRYYEKNPGAGFPAALNGVFAAQEVFVERDATGQDN